jgi:hypothetical protein
MDFRRRILENYSANLCEHLSIVANQPRWKTSLNKERNQGKIRKRLAPRNFSWNAIAVNSVLRSGTEFEFGIWRNFESHLRLTLKIGFGYLRLRYWPWYAMTKVAEKSCWLILQHSCRLLDRIQATSSRPWIPFFKGWYFWVIRKNLGPPKKVARTIKELLAKAESYSSLGITNAVAEGINSNVMAIKRNVEDVGPSTIVRLKEKWALD